MSDRILLLNNGVIEQQGTPLEMYGQPRTLFTADFMGSNNRIEGRVGERRDGAVRLDGNGWQLWGTPRGAPADAGSSGASGATATATGMVRLERVRLVDGPGEHRLRLPLVTSMFLGDHWEHLFQIGQGRLRAHGDARLADGAHWVEVQPADLWVFAGT